MSRLTKKLRPTESNLSKIPNQSGIYLLYRKTSDPYIGSAEAGRLQKRIREQLNQKRGITSIRYRPATSKREALSLEERYRDKHNPKQRYI